VKDLFIDDSIFQLNADAVRTILDSSTRVENLFLYNEAVQEVQLEPFVRFRCLAI
jgi:hypothetical protein